MSPFLVLLKKELRSLLPAGVVWMGGYLAWQMVVRYALIVNGRWGSDLYALIWSPLMILPLLGVLGGALTLAMEWPGNSIYLMRSLPLRGVWVVGSKLLALLSWLMAGGILGALVSFINLTSGPWLRLPSSLPPVGATLAMVILLTLYSAAFLAVLITIGQVTLLVASCSRRIYWLLAPVGIVFFPWLILRGGLFLSRFLRWIPQLPMVGVEVQNSIWVVHQGGFRGATLIGGAIIALGLFALSTWVWDRHIEV